MYVLKRFLLTCSENTKSMKAIYTNIYKNINVFLEN